MIGRTQPSYSKPMGAAMPVNQHTERMNFAQVGGREVCISREADLRALGPFYGSAPDRSNNKVDLTHKRKG
jgi:hypothetical protein